MKKKSILINLFLIGIILWGIIPGVLAVTYTCGLTAGDSYIIEVVSIDASYAVDGEVGQQGKFQIDSITDAGTDFNVKMTSWAYGVAFDVPGSSLTMSVSKDPATSTSWSFIVLLPIADYLAGIKTAYGPSFELMGGSVTVSGSTLTMDMGTAGNMIMIYTYDAKGFVTNGKITDGSDKVLMEYRIVSATIPGYDIAIILGISCISLFGIIMHMLRKKVVR